MYRRKRQEYVCEACNPDEYGKQQECGYQEYGQYAEAGETERADSCGRHRQCMLSPEAVREIRSAIDDELGAVAEYATMARKFKDDPVMQAWVTNIAGDEYGHARAFSMVLAASGCADAKHCKEEHKCREEHECKDDRKCKKDHRCKDDHKCRR